MICVATGDVDVKHDEFVLTAEGSSMLREAVQILKHEQEPRRIENYITGFLLMSAKAGIKKHGDKDIAALLKEFVQLNDKDTSDVTNPRNQTRSQKNKTLRDLSIVTEKRDLSTKGMTCTDGSKQRQ